MNIACQVRVRPAIESPRLSTRRSRRRAIAIGRLKSPLAVGAGGSPAGADGAVADGTMTERASEELTPSELGTHEFWENAYAQELDNFRDHGDVGEIWFGAANARKVARWIATKLDLNKENDKIIDIGCGNGMTLVELAKEGFTNLTGVDYSQKGVDLARIVLNDNNLPTVKIEICDILNDTLQHDFKVVHDKGTYDAISLNPKDPMAKRQKYVENIHSILLPDGYFVLTSCNWTKEELLKHFSNHFVFINQLPTDTFQFGGQTGNTITQLVFKKK